MKKLIIIATILLFAAMAYASSFTERRISLIKRVNILENKIDSLLVRIKKIEEKVYPKRTNVNFQNSFKVGDVGYLNQVKILHIIDSNNILAEFNQYSHSVVPSSFPRESRFLTSVPSMPVYKQQIVYIKGIDTSNFRDDQIINVDNNYKITGNKSIYDKYEGKRTLFLLEPYKE